MLFLANLVFSPMLLFSQTGLKKRCVVFSDQLSDNSTAKKRFVIKHFSEQITIESLIAEPTGFAVSVFNMMGQRLGDTYYPSGVNYAAVEKLELAEGVFVLVISGGEFRRNVYSVSYSPLLQGCGRWWIVVLSGKVIWVVK